MPYLPNDIMTLIRPHAACSVHDVSGSKVVHATHVNVNTSTSEMGTSRNVSTVFCWICRRGFVMMA